jgi:hypothetical protein
MSEKMRIWDLVERTDPAHTREAKPFGKVITAIDSYYQIKRATEVFGPFGTGWGYSLEHSTIPVGSAVMAVASLQLWYREPDPNKPQWICQCGPVVAMNYLLTEKGRTDEEAFKKATTDALTKSLSYLGFSADIFMGLYDDSKYKAENKKHFDEKRDAGKPMPDEIDRIVKLIPSIASLTELEDTYYKLFGNPKAGVAPHGQLASCNEAQRKFIMLMVKKRKAELWVPEDSDEKAKRLEDAASS